MNIRCGIRVSLQSRVSVFLLIFIFVLSFGVIRAFYCHFRTWASLQGPCICICVNIYIIICGITIRAYKYQVSGPGQVCKARDLQHLAAPLLQHLPCLVIPLHPNSTHLLIFRVYTTLQPMLHNRTVFFLPGTKLMAIYSWPSN